MTTSDQIEQLAKYSDQAGVLLDNLDGEIQAIKENPLIAACHPKLLEAQAKAHLAREAAEQASQQLRDIVAPASESRDSAATV